jgi:hypothetical protein
MCAKSQRSGDEVTLIAHIVGSYKGTYRSVCHKPCRSARCARKANEAATR